MQPRSRVYVLERIMQLLHQNMKLSDSCRGRSTVKSGWGFSGLLHFLSSGGSGGGDAAKASCGWVLAASVVPGRWRLRDEVMRRPAEAGRLLTPAEAGRKLVGHCRARLFMNCAAIIFISRTYARPRYDVI